MMLAIGSMLELAIWPFMSSFVHLYKNKKKRSCFLLSSEAEEIFLISWIPLGHLLEHHLEKLYWLLLPIIAQHLLIVLIKKKVDSSREGSRLYSTCSPKRSLPCECTETKVLCPDFEEHTWVVCTLATRLLSSPHCELFKCGWYVRIPSCLQTASNNSN